MEEQQIKEFLFLNNRRVGKTQREEFVKTIQQTKDGTAHYHDKGLVIGVDVGAKDDFSTLTFGTVANNGAIHVSEVAQYADVAAAAMAFESARRDAEFFSVPAWEPDVFPSDNYRHWLNNHREYFSEGLFNNRPGLSNMSSATPNQAPVCTISPAEEAAQKPSMAIPRVSLEDVETSVDELTADLAHKVERLFGYSVLRQSRKLGNPLRRILRELEVEPFDPRAVEAYKTQAALYRTAELKREIMARPNFLKMSQWEVNANTRAVWHREELGEYEREVPLHALNLAVQIKEALPEVEVYIDELHDDPFLVAEYDGQEYFIAVWSEREFEASLG